MLEALVFGIVASSALVIGSVIGVTTRIPERVLALLLAFASGALMTALAFELFEDAHQKSGAWMAGIAFVAGAAVFVAVSSWLDRRVANAIGTDTMSAREVAALDPKERGRGAAGAKEGAGFALLAAVTLDGIPENAALGVTLGGEDETSPSSSRSSRRTSRNHGRCRRHAPGRANAWLRGRNVAGGGRASRRGGRGGARR